MQQLMSMQRDEVLQARATVGGLELMAMRGDIGVTPSMISSPLRLFLLAFYGVRSSGVQSLVSKQSGFLPQGDAAEANQPASRPFGHRGGRRFRVEDRLCGAWCCLIPSWYSEGGACAVTQAPSGDLQSLTWATRGSKNNPCQQSPLAMSPCPGLIRNCPRFHDELGLKSCRTSKAFIYLWKRFGEKAKDDEAPAPLQPADSWLPVYLRAHSLSALQVRLLSLVGGAGSGIALVFFSSPLVVSKPAGSGADQVCDERMVKQSRCVRLCASVRRPRSAPDHENGLLGQ